MLHTAWSGAAVDPASNNGAMPAAPLLGLAALAALCATAAGDSATEVFTLAAGCFWSVGK